MKAAKLLAATLVLVSGVASAQLKGYGGFEYTTEENRITNAESIKGAFVIGAKTPTNWDFSAKLESGQAELGNGNISSGVETRIRKTFSNAIGPFSPWFGVRLGQSIKKDIHFGYYAAEGGLKFPIVGSLSGDLAYRHRNSFADNNFETNRTSLQLNYALTKQDSVGVRFARSTGDSEVDAWRISYTRSF
jgi:hypothetical protein